VEAAAGIDSHFAVFIAYLLAQLVRIDRQILGHGSPAFPAAIDSRLSFISGSRRSAAAPGNRAGQLYALCHLQPDLDLAWRQGPARTRSSMSARR
jgi:hypothetical protein